MNRYELPSTTDKISHNIKHFIYSLHMFIFMYEWLCTCYSYNMVLLFGGKLTNHTENKYLSCKTYQDHIELGIPFPFLASM